MNENATVIGRNLKTIRESYGETQLDLTQMLGYDSTATISMLEGGSRGQNRYDSLSAIARHYRIPESLLFYPDLPKLPDYPSLPLDDPDSCRRLYAAVFPSVYSKAAMENDLFRRTCAEQLEAEKEMLNTLCFPKESFSKCLAQYEECLERHQLPEAAANSLWWILLYGLFSCYPGIPEGMKMIRRKAISIQEFFRSWYLPDCSNDTAWEEDSLKKTFQSRFGEKIRDLSRMLYMHPNGIQAAEYYTALFYCFALSGSPLREGDSRLAGWTMLQVLSDMGNPCAKECLAAIRVFHKV